MSNGKYRANCIMILYTEMQILWIQLSRGSRNGRRVNEQSRCAEPRDSIFMQFAHDALRR